MTADSLDGMAVFVAVAEARNFRVAGGRLGVSASAVSQTLRKVERRLGVVLVQRTTRSVRLTAAGERLYASVRPALEEVRGAIAALGELSDEPRGTLRLYVADAAESLLHGPMLAGFLASQPHVDLDIAVSNAPVDIVAAGYDAGIQLGEVIDRDMIAVPVSGDLRLVVVGSPSYLARRGGQARDDVTRCDLVPVLEEFSDPFSGFYLYYPQRRHASPALRALVEYLKAARKPGRRTKHARQDR